MRISQPSFRIKKSRELFFSSDSKRVFSIGSRLNAFSVDTRNEIYSKKHMKHEVYIAKSQDDKFLCIKNTNGELVTCYSKNGDIVHEAGRIEHFNEGEKIYYSQCNKYLIDMCWTGEIQIYNTKTLKIIFKIEPPADYMITSSDFNPKDKSYTIYYSPRHKEKSPPFIVLLKENDILSNKVIWSTQKSKIMKFLFGFVKWSEQKLIVLNQSSTLSRTSINPKGDLLAVIYISKFKKLKSQHSLAIFNLENGKLEKEVELFPFMTQIDGLSWSHDSKHIFISTDYLPDEAGLTFFERYEKYHPQDTCKITIVNSESLKVVKTIAFPEAKNVIFSNDNQYVAIASTIKGLVLHKSHVNKYFGVEIF